MTLTNSAVISLTGLLLGIWGCVTSLEWIANVKLFRAGAVFDAHVLELRQSRSGLALLNGHPQERAMLAVFVARLLASVLIVLGSGLVTRLSPEVQIVAACSLLWTSVFTIKRAGYGADGSDQMGVVVTLGYILMLIGAWRGSALTFIAGTLLNAGQLTLAFFVSGVSKWLSRAWRSGVALPGVVGTHSYGHDVAARVIGGRPTVAVAMCWLIFLAETTFPVFLLLRPSLFQPILSCSLVFLLSNALFMGLNAFVWSFSACYPSVIFLNAYLGDSNRLARLLAWQ